MTIGGNNVAHGGMNRCKTQIKQRLGGACTAGAAALIPQPCRLIPRRKIVGTQGAPTQPRLIVPRR